jgi:TPR repeat protein
VDRIGVSKERITAARYFRFAAEQGIAEAQYRYGISFLTDDAGRRNITDALLYLKLSAENSSPNGQFVIACLAENGLPPFPSTDLDTAVRSYEQCCDLSPIGAVCLGWCLQTVRDIPGDFTAAVQCLKRAADSNDPDSVNCFGVDRAVSHYRRAASLGHQDALFNLGRSLESGKGIGQDALRAVKHYRLSAEMNNAAAQNSFAIYLERGIGAHKSLSLAAQFYRRAADQGHADGANNCGFCLEHGRGVAQNFEMAAEYYGFAAECGHAEAKLNCARCMRLTEIFRPFFENPDPLGDDERRLIAALQRIKTTAPAIRPSADPA